MRPREELLCRRGCGVAARRPPRLVHRRCGRGDGPLGLLPLLSRRGIGQDCLRAEDVGPPLQGGARARAGRRAAHNEENLARRASWEAEHGRKPRGRRPQARDPEALAKRKINTTDPDTRLLNRAAWSPQIEAASGIGLSLEDDPALVRSPAAGPRALPLRTSRATRVAVVARVAIEISGEGISPGRRRGRVD